MVDSFSFSSQHILVLELCKGEALLEIFCKKTFRVQDYREITNQLLNAILHMHSYGVYHLDIKPENIMINYSPKGTVEVKIIDFGAAVISNSDFTDVFILTPQFAPPEAIAAMVPITAPYGEILPKRQIDEKYLYASDIWALAYIVFAMTHERYYLCKNNTRDPKWHHTINHRFIISISRSSTNYEDIAGISLIDDIYPFIDGIKCNIAFFKKILMLSPSDRPTASELLNFIKTNPLEEVVAFKR